jgi:hypothetical protein
MRKPSGWQRLASPHEIYRVGHPPVLVAYGRLAIEHALTMARGATEGDVPPLVAGIVRTSSPRQWCVTLAQADGSLTWIGMHRLLTEAEGQVRQLAEAFRQHNAADPASLATLVAELKESGSTLA